MSEQTMTLHGMANSLTERKPHPGRAPRPPVSVAKCGQHLATPKLNANQTLDITARQQKEMCIESFH